MGNGKTSSRVETTLGDVWKMCLGHQNVSLSFICRTEHVSCKWNSSLSGSLLNPRMVHLVKVGIQLWKNSNWRCYVSCPNTAFFPPLHPSGVFPWEQLGEHWEHRNAVLVLLSVPWLPQLLGNSSSREQPRNRNL